MRVSILNFAVPESLIYNRPLIQAIDAHISKLEHDKYPMTPNIHKNKHIGEIPGRF